MHNDIMADGSREPKPTTSTEEAIPEHNVFETYKNTTPEKRAYFDAEAEAIRMILSGIRDDIYSTVDACNIAKEMWIANERLQNANPLALIAATQHYPDQHYQALKAYKTYAPSSKHTPSTRSHAPTRNKGKEIAKPITPPSESAFEEDEDKQGDWIDDTDEEPDEQELEAHYMYMAKIQEVLTADSGPTFNAEPLEQVQSNEDYNVFATERKHSGQSETINDTYVVEMVDSNVILNSSDMRDNEEHVDQNAKEYEDECVVLANLIANLKLNHDENKKIQKRLEKANASLTR
ncbi:hypothetical protein Tco_1201614 [Tanacetum coccineum]